MAKFKSADKNHSRFAIERDIQKQIDPIEYDIQALKKDYDVILSHAQKAFDKNEKEYQKALETLNTKHVKESRNEIKALEKDLQDARKKLSTLRKSHETYMEDILKKHHDKLNAIDAQIQAIEKERTKTLKTIEQKHQKTTKTFEEKLNIYKQALYDNKNHHNNMIENAITSLKSTYHKEHDALNKLDETLNQDFESLEHSMLQQVEGLKDDLKQEKNTIEYQINSMRKTLNTLLKTYKKTIYSVSASIKEPFEKSKAILETLKSSYHQNEEDFILQFTHDVDAEIQRLKHTVASNEAENVEANDNETNESEKEKKEAHNHDSDLISKQISLNQEREKGIKTHSEIKLELLEASFDVFNHGIDTLNTKTKSIFDTHETLMESQVSRVKNILDVLQSSASSNQEKLSEITDILINTNILTPYKSLFKHVFKALHTFEQERLKALENTLHTLKPYYEEIDDIRFYLDTKDARKEIKLNQERIKVEQRDASLNNEMDITKKHHDKLLLTIEHDHFIKEQKALHSIEDEKQTQTLNDLSAYKHAYNDRIKHNLEKQKATLYFNYQQKQIDVDLKQLNDRKAIEETILNNRKTLEKIEALKQKRLKLLELKDSIHNDKERLQLTIDEHSVQIARIEETIKQREERIERTFEHKKDALKDKFINEKTSIEDAIKETENTFEKKHAFIDKAYEKETQKAKKQIDYIDSIYQKQQTPIKTSYLTLKQRIITHINAINDYDQKSTIQLLHPNFKADVLNYLEEMHRTFITVLEFSKTQQLDALDNSDLKKRKKQSKKQKVEAFIKDTDNTMQSMLETTKKTINQAFKTPMDYLKKKGSISLPQFKSMVLTMLKTLKETHNESFETFDTLLHTLLNPLKSEEQAFIEKAESSSANAKQKTLHSKEEKIAPLKNDLKQLEENYEKELNKLNTTLNNEKQQAIGSLYEKENDLKTSIENNKHALNHLDETIKEKETSIETTYQNHLQSINANYEQYHQDLHDKYAKQESKINERLENAKAIHTQATINAENALESIERVLEDTQTYNKENFTYIKEKLEKQLDASKQEKREKQEKANQDLKNKLNDFEEQILTSKARLEEQNEQVSRAIEDEMNIKTTKLSQLNESIQKEENALENTFEDLLQTLNNTLTEAFSYMKDTKQNAETLLDAYISQHKKTTNDFIQATIQSIKSS